MDLDQFLSRFRDVRPTNANQWAARCPSHEDSSPSLSIGLGLEGRRLVYCHGGCDVREILYAVGLTPSDLFAMPRVRPQEAPGSTRSPEGLSTPSPRPSRFSAWHSVWHDAHLIGVERHVAEAARAAADRLPDPEGEVAWALRALAAEIDSSANDAEAEQLAQLRARHDAKRQKGGPHA